MAAVDEIKRTAGPQTKDGRRWEVPLNDTPTDEWLALFKASPEGSGRARPQRVDFDRGTASFKSDEDQVEHWVLSVDEWIASTNARYLMALERAQRARVDRVDEEAKERDRIQRLNDRFKDL